MDNEPQPISLERANEIADNLIKSIGDVSGELNVVGVAVVVQAVPGAYAGRVAIHNHNALQALADVVSESLKKKIAEQFGLDFQNPN